MKSSTNLATRLKVGAPVILLLAREDSMTNTTIEKLRNGFEKVFVFISLMALVAVASGADVTLSTMTK